MGHFVLTISRLFDGVREEMKWCCSADSRTAAKEVFAEKINGYGANWSIKPCSHQEYVDKSIYGQVVRKT